MVNYTNSGDYVGEYDIDDIFNIKLSPFGQVSYDLTPIEPPEEVQIRVRKTESPNSYAAYELQIDNFKMHFHDKNYTLFELLPKHDALAQA